MNNNEIISGVVYNKRVTISTQLINRLVIMNIIEDLKNKIKISTSRINSARKQVESHRLGDVKLSYLSYSSLELSIEKNQFLLDKYKKKLQKLTLEDVKEIEKKHKKKQEILKNNYYKYQMLRIKHDKVKTQKEIMNALDILEDIPKEIKLNDEDIFAISHKSEEVFLKIHSNLDDDLIEIKNEFISLVEDKFNETNNELRLLNSRIPIVILQLRILLQNIKENIDEENLNTNKFVGLPKFEDWWIHELWSSPQAYMGLFKWQEIVLSLCISTEQKRAFEVIFKNWILIKKLLNTKGGYGYFYNHAFDEMISKYADLEDEYDKENLKSMEKIILNLTEKENFKSVSKEHNELTPYMKFKLEKEEEKRAKEDLS